MPGPFFDLFEETSFHVKSPNPEFSVEQGLKSGFMQGW